LLKHCAGRVFISNTLCGFSRMKKFVILSLLIALLICRLSGFTEGGDNKEHKQNTSPSENVAAIQHAKSDDPLFDQAVVDYQAGMYADALEKFKMVSQKEPDESPRKERLMRSIADSHYFLGLKGGKNNLLTASDIYKNIIQKYPGSRDDNAVALYRVADSYATLNFYYEAKREFENFCATYPDSPYVPEAVFKMGDVLYKMKKYDEAALKYEEYVRKFPAGKYVKTAYFSMGDCYSQAHKEEIAEKWYRDALDKWPELENIPEDVLLNIGFHYFRSMKYRHALRIFFFYINTFPDNENCKRGLFFTARSLMELDQLPLSLKMYSLLIERFPNSREAMESAIIMANIGVKKPGMKVPLYFQGMQNYKYPLQTYNDMLAKFPTGEYAEDLLFQKGFLLFKNSRYKESFEAYRQLLFQFPQGKYRAEAMKYFMVTADRLVEENYTKGDYLALSDIYFKSRDKGLISGDNFKMAYAMGDSLRRLRLNDEAMEVFEKLLKTAGSIVERNKTLVAIADTECERGNYDNAERALSQLSAVPAEADRKSISHSRKSRSKGTVKPSVPESSVQRHMNRIMGNISFKKGQFEKAVLYYAKVLASGESIEGVAMIYRNYAECLKAMNSLTMAVVSYQKAIEAYNRESQKYPVEVIIDSYRGLGDCLYEGGQYLEAISMYKQSLTQREKHTENLWILYSMGRGYAELRESSMADKTFSELKTKGGEGFWSYIADHALREYIWHEKYALVRK
jgi:tetratricopeptide (TPR) repeat protein